MGKKQKGKGKHLFLYSACILIILLSGAGCASLSSQKRLKEGYKHLDQAEKLISKGDYAGALKENEEAIILLPGTSPGDKALFHMGLIWVNPDNPDRDYKRALESFQQIVRIFPDSGLTEEVRAWVGAINKIILYESRVKDQEAAIDALKNQLAAMKEADTRIEGKNKSLEETIRALKKQLNDMKEIDLRIEEKKREDSPAKTNR